MYADTITESMQKTIDETERRRLIQMKYNEEHGITPQQIKKSIKSLLTNDTANSNTTKEYSISENELNSNKVMLAADEIIVKMSKEQLRKSIQYTTELMKQAAKDLDFLQAAQYRDELLKLQEQLELKES